MLDLTGPRHTFRSHLTPHTFQLTTRGDTSRYPPSLLNAPSAFKPAPLPPKIHPPSHLHTAPPAPCSPNSSSSRNHAMPSVSLLFERASERAYRNVPNRIVRMYRFSHSLLCLQVQERARPAPKRSSYDFRMRKARKQEPASRVEQRSGRSRCRA